MARVEDPLSEAERHVWRFEEAVARQAALVKELEGGGDPREVGRAREELARFEESLGLAHEHLRMEREVRGLGP